MCVPSSTIHLRKRFLLPKLNRKNSQIEIFHCCFLNIPLCYYLILSLDLPVSLQHDCHSDTTEGYGMYGIN